MDFLELSEKRYTTKAYDPNKRISDELIKKLEEIIRLSPSSINSQPWKFVFISDKKTKERLAEFSKHNAEKVLNASHLIVFCSIDSISMFEEQIRRNLAASAIDYYFQNIKPRGEAEIKYWLERQLYISLGYFLAACASLEVDSTAMEGIEKQGFDDVLKLKGYKTLFAVAVGYRDPNDENQPSLKPKSRLPLEEIIEII